MKVNQTLIKRSDLSLEINHFRFEIQEKNKYFFQNLGILKRVRG